MPYGFAAYNEQGIKVLDTDKPLLTMSDIVDVISPIGGNIWNRNMYKVPPYNSPNITSGASHFCFQVGSNINNILIGRNSGIDEYYGSDYQRPGFIGFNNNSNMGNRTFRYVSMSDNIPKDTGGYGLEIFDETGKKIYRFSDKVLKIDNTYAAYMNSTISIPNNTWVCPMIVADRSSANVVLKTKLIRQGTTSNWKVEPEQGSVSSTVFGILLLTFTM